ncbi:unnamed protein product [Brassica oleracea]
MIFFWVEMLNFIPIFFFFSHQREPRVPQWCWEDRSSHEPPTESPHSNDPRKIQAHRLALTPRTEASSTMPNQHYTTGEHWRAARRDGREEHHEYPQKTSRAAPTEKGGQRWSNNRADQGKVIDGPAREQTGCHTRTRRNNGDHTEAFTATLAHRRRLRIHTLPVKTKGARSSTPNLTPNRRI